MRTTPYKGYALYEPDASPDLTESGEYNTALMAVDADMHDEVQARVEGDTALNIAIANETAQRKVADDALGKRIDNAEVEISTNSADLTGIKGLTYGDTHVNFLENSNGEYSSPALDEIAEQMAQRITYVQIPVGAATIDAANLDKITSDWPNVALLETGADPLADGPTTPYFPLTKEDSDYLFSPIEGTYSESGPYARGISIAKTGTVSRFNIENAPYWDNVQVKPFSTIGTGLKVVDKALTVDTAAISAGITANTTWGEIESAATLP